MDESLQVPSTRYWLRKQASPLNFAPESSSETSETNPPGASMHDHPDRLIANHRLATVVLILMLAFTLCAAFTQCHSKLVRRYHLTGIEVARQLRVSVSKLPPKIRAPDSPAPQSPTI